MKYPRLIDDGSVWIVVVPPVIWAAHFLISNWGAAVWCQDALSTVTWQVLGLTVVALAGIGWVARIAVARYGGLRRPRRDVDRNTPHGRRAFLGHLALLLAALNGVAVLLTAVPALVFGQC